MRWPQGINIFLHQSSLINTSWPGCQILVKKSETIILKYREKLKGYSSDKRLLVHQKFQFAFQFKHRVLSVAAYTNQIKWAQFLNFSTLVSSNGCEHLRVDISKRLFESVKRLSRQKPIFFSCSNLQTLFRCYTNIR